MTARSAVARVWPAAGGDAVVEAPVRRVRAARISGTALLSVGTVASGVLAYAFNALAARSLGPELYGPVAVLWAAVFLAAVVLFRPLEQTLSRGIAERAAHGIDSRPVLVSVVRLGVVVCGAAVLVCLLTWSELVNRLFDGHTGLAIAFVGAIVGYCASYLVRGVVSGTRWFGGYGMLLLADGTVRLVVALPLVFVASPGVAALAVALAAIGGAVAPLLARRTDLRRDLAVGERLHFDVRSALRFALPVTAVAAAEQILVSGGPLLIMLAGGAGAASAAGVVFAATMLVRAPVFLFQGVSAALLPSLTRFDALGDHAAFRRSLARVGAILLAFAGVLVAMALLAGPRGMHILYGDGFAATREDLAILAVGVGAYLVAATLSQAVLARGRATAAGAIWMTAAAAFVVVELTMSGAPLHRVSVAFTAAAALMAALFFALVLRGNRSPAR
jgi:O-antigen/teichoic acid export membrane protein